MSIEIKQQVLAAAKGMLRKGLTEGTAGNISARMPDGSVCITPSSVDYELMTLDDLCVIDLDGNQVEGTRGPSSEKLLHLACYQAFDDIQSVIHSHPIYATMFAVARMPIPACIDEFTTYVGGEVAVTEYAMSGTPDVGANAVAVLADRGAALIANHGMVAVGPAPKTVLHITALVERSAQIVWGAMTLGKIHEVPTEATEAFRNYYSFLRTTAL